MWKHKTILIFLPLFWAACQSSPTDTKSKAVLPDQTFAISPRPDKIATSSLPKETTETNNTSTEEVLGWREDIVQPPTADTKTLEYPYEAPPKENIAKAVFDSSFESINSNIVLKGATWDSQIAHHGTRSIHLTGTDDTIFLKHIPVEEGQWYVITGYMYVDTMPSDVVRYYVEYRHGEKRIDLPNYPMVAVAKANVWEPFVLPLYIKKDANVTDIWLAFRNVGRPKGTGVDRSGGVWLDDISIHKVSGSEHLYGFSKPGKKQGFDGRLVRVDALGNFSLKSDSGYRPFLPVIVYPGGDMRRWAKYREKGFNTIICNSLEEAETAVASGMYWIWDLYDYGIHNGDRDGYARFEREYLLMRASMPQLFEKLLYFYWDNERYLLFESIKHFSDTIKRLDVDAQGNRLRPFVMQLDFATGSPHYHNKTFDLVDLQGLYANPMIYEANDPVSYHGLMFKGAYNGEFANFAIFEHLPGVTIPKSVFVINSPHGDTYLANVIFAAFARGGKAFAYWKDGGSQPAIETKSWWKDFNQTVRQMQEMLPLLRRPHWTTWDLNVSMPDDEDGLVVGKRDFGQKRCVIYASRSDKAEKVRFATEGVEDGRPVFDYFSGKVRSRWQQGAFELALSPRDYGVCCW